MALKDDLDARVSKTFTERWNTREGRVVPSPSSVPQNNTAVHFERATVLYADLDASTNMVDQRKWWFAAEMYKNFLYSAARIINAEDGTITSYDGDRVMAVFVGGHQCTAAVRCALKINWARIHIINKRIKDHYPDTNFVLRHVVGIDTGELRAANTGVRGDNDLVWVGPAANYAAKLTSLSSDYPTRITERVHGWMNDDVVYGGDPRRRMWEKRVWTSENDMPMYRSSWWWSL